MGETEIELVNRCLGGDNSAFGGLIETYQDRIYSFALRLLREAGVYVHPGHLFDLPGDGYLVLSLLPQPGLFREGIERVVSDI